MLKACLIFGMFAIFSHVNRLKKPSDSPRKMRKVGIAEDSHMVYQDRICGQTVNTVILGDSDSQVCALAL